MQLSTIEHQIQKIANLLAKYNYSSWLTCEGMSPLAMKQRLSVLTSLKPSCWQLKHCRYSAFWQHPTPLITDCVYQLLCQSGKVYINQ